MCVSTYTKIDTYKIIYADEDLKEEVIGVGKIRVFGGGNWGEKDSPWTLKSLKNLFSL